FGLRQVALYWKRKEPAPVGFKTPMLYKQGRHAIYLSFLIAFWATPKMTLGHLVFAVATTGYILVAIQLEEHDLFMFFGDSYRQYREHTPMLLPFVKKPK